LNVLARQYPRAARRPGRDRLADGPVLFVVSCIEVVEFGARDPGDLADERPPRALRDPLDIRRPGAAVDHVMEGVVRLHPLDRKRVVLDACLRLRAQLQREHAETKLSLVEARQVVRSHPWRRQLRGQALQLRADEERLSQLLARQRPNTHATVRHEGDEPERRQPAERLADRRSRHAESLGELLLPEHHPGLDRARDDLVLEDEGDLVCLRRERRHPGRSKYGRYPAGGASTKLRPSTCTGENGSSRSAAHSSSRCATVSQSSASTVTLQPSLLSFPSTPPASSTASTSGPSTCLVSSTAMVMPPPLLLAWRFQTGLPRSSRAARAWTTRRRRPPRRPGRSSRRRPRAGDATPCSRPPRARTRAPGAARTRTCPRPRSPAPGRTWLRSARGTPPA